MDNKENLEQEGKENVDANAQESTAEEAKGGEDKVKDDLNDLKESAEEFIKAMADVGTSIFNLARSRFETTVADMQAKTSAKKADANELFEDAKEAGEDIVEEAEAVADEGATNSANMLNNLKDEVEKAKELFEDKFAGLTSSLKDRVNYPSREEYEALQARVEHLESLLKDKAGEEE